MPHFNPRPRAGGDGATVEKHDPPKKFQSTPPRRGRLLFQLNKTVLDFISIHAPAQGATDA